MVGNVQSKLKTAPNPQFVERGPQVIFYNLLGCAYEPGNLTVGQAFPNQCGDLPFLGSQRFVWPSHDDSSFSNNAVASLTRLRPSLIPARRNNVRRCCFTVRGLMFSSAAISLLLHPWTSSRSTCWSRGVIVISLRLIMGVSSGPSVHSWGRDPPET